MLYGELGRYPISVVVKPRMTAFRNRLVTGKTSKLSSCIYNYMKNQPNTESKWIIQIKHIVNNAGRSDLWLSQRNISNRQIHINIKQIYIDQYKQTWSSQLIESEKGRTYSYFKNSLERESYFQLLRIMTPLLCLNLELPILSYPWKLDAMNLSLMKIEPADCVPMILQDQKCTTCLNAAPYL